MISLVLLLALGGNDTMTVVTMGTMKFKAPTQWSLDAAEDGTTKTWTSHDEQGGVSFYTDKLEKSRPSKGCVDAMIDAVGAEGFERSTIAGQPAAKKITTDFVAQRESEKTEDNKVITTTWLGCDGTTKWLITFTARKSAGARFGPILRRMLDSISYGNGK